MTDAEIEILKAAVADAKTKKNTSVMWIPDMDLSRTVVSIGKHAEEGGDLPCAIFRRGDYAALYNCELQDFSIVTRLA